MKTDIVCKNGVIHVIDAVLMPKDIVDTAVAAESFKTLVTAIKAAELVDTLKGEGPFTSSRRPTRRLRRYPRTSWKLC